MSQYFKIKTPQGVKIIGCIEGDQLIKKVSRSRHFHRKTQSWAIQAEALERLRNLGVNYIKLEVDGGREVLTASLHDFIEHGVTADYGHGKQVFLRDRFWQRAQPPALTLF